MLIRVASNRLTVSYLRICKGKLCILQYLMQISYFKPITTINLSNSRIYFQFLIRIKLHLDGIMINFVDDVNFSFSFRVNLVRTSAIATGVTVV